MARSLLRQLEQIRRSAAYDDALASINTSSVAEPTVSGSLENDLNVVRSLMKQLKGNTDWYTDPGTYFNPANTNSGGASLETFNLNAIKDNTLDSKTIIIGVSMDNSGAGYTVSGTSTGVLLPLTTSYAGAGGGTNRTGLPVFASTANAGQYYDEAGDNNVCRLDVIDMSNDQEIQDADGTVIFAKFHDAADFSGTGTGTDIYARLYKGSGAGSVCDLSTVSGSAVTSIGFVYPQRKRLSDVSEHEWQRTDFISSWEGDVELVEDISNLWSYTGAIDNGTDPGPWTNEGASYILSSSPSDLKTAIDTLNTQIGDRLYTGDNYIDDGDTITESLDELDAALKVVADAVSAGVAEKYIESVAVLINKNTEHDMPAGWGATYTPDSTAGQEGSNMDVYVDGQLLAADTGAAGANADRDYAETTTSGVTFRFDIQVGRNITYMIKQ